MDVFQLRKKDGGTVQGLPIVYIINQAQTIIGRQEGNVHLHLPSNMISRQHAVIEKDAQGNHYLRDNESTNGTLLNDEFVEEPMLVSPGDIIVFGGDNPEMIDNFCYMFEPAFTPIAPIRNRTRGNKGLFGSFSKSNQIVRGQETEVNTNQIPTPSGEAKTDWHAMFNQKRRGSTSFVGSAPTQPKKYDMDQIKRTCVLTNEFCIHGTVRELDTLVNAKVNIKKIMNCKPTPFCVAVINNNQRMALRILHHINGEADLSHSELTEVPEAVVRMVQTDAISRLDLSFNKLLAIPADLSSLRYVDISNNPLTAIPCAYRDNWASLRKHLVDTVSIANDFRRRKVLVVGGEGTGKTTITKLLVVGKVDVSKRIKNESIQIRETTMGKSQLVFWNLGASLIKSEVHTLYLDTDCFYLLAFNFADLKLHEIEFWLKSIKYYINANKGQIYLIAVGTHCEKLSIEEINNTIETLHAKFPKRVYPFLTDIVALSCKTSSGLSTLKKKLKELAKSAFTQDIPSSWVQLNIKIKSLRVAGTHYVMFPEYAKWAEGVGIFEGKELVAATNFLTSIGSFINFKNVYGVDIVFLEPNSLFNLLEHLSEVGKDIGSGFLSQSQLSLVYRDFPESTYSEITKLLSASRIFVLLPNQRAYFANFVLPYTAPRSALSSVYPTKLKDGDACFGRVFKFQQLPLGLNKRVIASTLNFPGIIPEVVWQFGLLVRHKEEILVSIEYFPDSYKMSLELRFKKINPTIEKYALAFWRQVLENVRTQIEGFCSGTSWNEFIPCIHCIRCGFGRDRVYLFDYQTVIDSTDTPVMYCNHIESSSRCIARIEVAPDIALRDLPQVSSRRLTVGDQIGQGGFGVVYKGTLENKVVAVKELTCTNLDADLFREFQVEAFIQGLLNHPNCVRLYGLTAQPPRMILEFVSGGDLQHLLHPKKSPSPTLQTLPWRTRYRIAYDIAKGLYHMQTRNPPIIHRDIRSPNIFMTKEGKALIGDFGLARQVNPDIGGMLGTWQWLAPECIGTVECAYDERTDIYSFGMVLWELVSCAVPFEEFQDNPRYCVQGKLKLQELKHAIIEEDLRPSFPSDVPLDMKGMIQRCWSSDRESRPKAVQLLRWLARLVGEDAEREMDQTSSSSMTEDRLSSHVIFKAPEIIEDKPLMATTLLQKDGKPTSMACFGDYVWVGTSKGYMTVLCVKKKAIEVKLKWLAHGGRICVLLAVENKIWSSSSDDCCVNIWNADNLVIENTIKPFGEMAASSKGSQLCFGPSIMLLVNDTVWMCCPRTGKIIVCTAHDFVVVHTIHKESLIGMSDLAFHKNQIWVSNGGQINLFDIDGSDIGSFQAHNHGKRSTYVQSVGDIVWTVCQSELRVWDAPSLDLMSLAKEKFLGDSKYTCLYGAPENGRLFSGSFNGEIVMWNTKTCEPMQEIVPTKGTIRNIITCGDYTWCSTCLYQIFVFPATSLHTKPNIIKNDIQTIRNAPARRGPVKMLPSDRRAHDSSSVSSSELGRRKKKAVTLRNIVDEEGMSDEEVQRRLANPMVTLRRIGLPHSSPSSKITKAKKARDSGVEKLKIMTANGQLLPCSLDADTSITVAALLQKLIPKGLQQMNIYEAELPYEIMYYSGTTPARFLPSDLRKPVLSYGKRFILNRIPKTNLEAILKVHNIQIYCVVNAQPIPSSQIQIFSA